MWLPNPIYHTLPHSYGLAGGFTIVHADSPTLFISGLLLVLAGYMAWKLRRSARQPVRLNRRSRIRKPARHLRR